MTKIQIKFLRALEEDAYGQLPSAPFVVGFLRAYAQCLCLDHAAIIAAYHKLHGVHHRVERPRPLVTHQMWGTKHLGLVGLGVVIVILIVIAGLVLRQSRLGQQARRDDSPMSETVDTALATSMSVAEPVRAAPPLPQVNLSIPAIIPSQASVALLQEFEPGSETVGLSEEPTPAATRAPEASVPSEEVGSEATLPPLVLQANAVEDTWLRVEIDGKERHALLLQSGKSRRWEATERFALTVGNVQGTRLILNGQDIPLPPVRSNVVRDFLLTRELLN